MTSFPRWLLTLAVLSLLAGCATGNSPDMCAGWKPIRPSAADVANMSDGTVHQILAHNRFGAQNCGWK